MLASVGLVGCPGDGGGNGDGGVLDDSCPQLSGDWQASGGCTNTSCEISQNGCAFTIACDDGTTFTGTVASDSVTFSDDTARCSGEIQGLDNEVNGSIAPQLEGTCTPKTAGAGEACDFYAECFTGDCRIPEDDGGDGGDSGQGGAGGVSGGDSGEGGESGEGGAGGFLGGGAGGIGGDSGAGSGGAGSGGVGGGDSGAGGGSGGAVDPNVCGNCIVTACETESLACANAGSCADVVDCAIASTCSLDDNACVDAYCADTFASIDLTEEAQLALIDVQGCTDVSCTSECFVSVSCTDTCEYAGDDECDDGGDGAQQYCPLGTDCTDCGPR